MKHTNNGREYELVVVPERVKGFMVTKMQIDNDLVYPNGVGGYKYVKTLPIGNYTIIGKANELTRQNMCDMLHSEWDGAHSWFGLNDNISPLSKSLETAFANMLEYYHLKPETTLILLKY